MEHLKLQSVDGAFKNCESPSLIPLYMFMSYILLGRESAGRYEYGDVAEECHGGGVQWLSLGI
ncbi:hypothetical protein C1H46_002061 [Malus baccata]|uniref:Uncharacterized protein n=1 Tax=Malus baccata TaxID=106549 RepID=A0A540NMZ7_MALBA|nr:hypothetical protein C1H46_002061 [Malus baccata]